MTKRKFTSLFLLTSGMAIGWFSSHLQFVDRSDAQESASAAVVEVESETTDTALAESPLATLDWLTGDWVDAAEDPNIEFSCDFTKNKAFLIRSFSTARQADKLMSGMQVVAWDPVQEIIRSWTFDSDGGFGEDAWSQSGNRYTIRTKYTLADGGVASALNVLTYVNDDTFTWKSVHREIDGELQADVEEITLMRAVVTPEEDAANATGDEK